MSRGACGTSSHAHGVTVGDSVGEGVGATVGKGERQRSSKHTPLPQSVPAEQSPDSPQPGQLPPQSTSDSSPVFYSTLYEVTGMLISRLYFYSTLNEVTGIS